MAPRSICVLIVACLCASGGQCHSFKQVKRRFGQPRVIRLTRPFSPSRLFADVNSIGSSKFYISTRGGGMSDAYDEVDGSTSAFSQFIASFESELSDIRREAEMEAEIEMQRLLGLVDESQTGDEEEEKGEEVGDQQQQNTEYDNEISDDEHHNVRSVPVEEVSDADDIPTEYEQLEVAEEVMQNESELSENEQDVSGSIGDDEDIDDLDEEEEQEFAALPKQADKNVDNLDGKQQEDMADLISIERNIIDSDETQQHAVSEEVEQDKDEGNDENIDSLNKEQLEDETLPTGKDSDVGLDEKQQDTDLSSIITESDAEPIESSDIETNIDDIEPVPETKPKKQQKTKSKKSRVRKAKKLREIIPDDDDEIEGIDELDHSDSNGLSSVGVTKQKEIQRTKAGLRYYLKTDLVRAAVLFIATIVVSIWLQRVQRQMEAQGI